MDDTATCPGCGRSGSTVFDRFENGQGCPSCGLSSAAAQEIMEVRQSFADAELIAKCDRALKERDEALRELGLLRYRIREVEAALKREPPSW